MSVDQPLPAILAVGIATLDIINHVDGYPQEDGEVRALSQRVTRGGNATNTLSVLSQLGHRCAWAGVLVDEPNSDPILADLARHRISTVSCKRLTHGKMPVSYITLNVYNGSRTIIHYRDLPEFEYADFCQIDLQNFAWIHFEGRNVAQTGQMLKYARSTQAMLSLEVEKPRADLESLFPLVDVLLVGQQYVRSQGYRDAETWLSHWHRRLPTAYLVCAWGEQGAYGCAPHNAIYHHAAAYLPPQVKDTLGAGDTFNAALIHALSQGWEFGQALDLGCRLAGAKCGREGLILTEGTRIK